MARIPTTTERELQGLNPADLGDDFLDRLTACAEGTFTELSAEELEFEASLRTIRPKGMPAKLSDTLLATLGETPFAVDGKILLFHKTAAERPAAARAGGGFTRKLAVAAAVALLGSLSAFMVPQQAKQALTENTAPDPAPAPAISTPNPANLAPASFGSAPSETRDEGVIWHGKNQPHRVLRLTFKEKIITKDADGKPISMERPRVEYVIIPEKVD